MGAHRGRFPEFDSLSDAGVRKLCGISRLSEDDMKIAICILIQDMTYMDAGAEVNRSRTGIEWRMKNVIAPKLRMNLQHV